MAREPDGVREIEHLDDRQRTCGMAWAVFWKGEKIDLHFGCKDEADAMLFLLRGKIVPPSLQSAIDARRRRMTEGWI